MKKTLLAILILVLAAGLLFAGEKTEGKTKAADFVLKDIDGKNYQLSQNLGKGPIVINFWATWCIPCQEEMKKMKSIYKKYSKKGVQFLAISVDDPKTVGRVKAFVKSRRYPFHVLLDTNNDVMRQLQGTVPPYTLILDKEGNIVYSHVGYRVGDEKKVEKVLSELVKH